MTDNDHLHAILPAMPTWSGGLTGYANGAFSAAARECSGGRCRACRAVWTVQPLAADEDACRDALATGENGRNLIQPSPYDLTVSGPPP